MFSSRGIFSRCFCVLLLIFNAVSADDEQAPTVTTDLGEIFGTITKSQRGANIYTFLGIPYAKAPINELRFKAPVEMEPWDESMDATSNSLICPQPGINRLMSEDCLKLNVFSPNLDGNAPVMVYIHGGANIIGSGHSLYEAGPHYLLDHDVVLVAFNYRLGALGFLSTGTEEAPGNFGYLDQVMALKWVKKHIKNFGGNPESVTIFGVSAGGMAVTLHMASPLSRGLFHRAIAMSGSATSHYYVNNKYWTQKLARDVKCPMYNPKDVVDCLRDVSWEDIITACNKWEPYLFPNMKWNYEVDGRFLMKHPSDVFYDEDFHKVPLIAGITRNEFDFCAYHQEQNTGLLNDIDLNFDLYAPEFYQYDINEDLDKENKTSDSLKEFYIGFNSSISAETIEDFGRIFSDSQIGHGVYRLIDLARQYVDVYNYRLDYIGNVSTYQDENGIPRGVSHGDDLRYIMPSTVFNTILDENDPEMFMVDRMTTWWTTFARTGSPNPTGTTETIWEPSTKNKTVCMYNNVDTQLGEYPYQDRYDLWENLFPLRESGSQRVQLTALLFIMIAVLRFIF